MTTLTIDELSRGLRRRWGWPASADHVPADPASPLLPDGGVETASSSGGTCGGVVNPLVPGLVGQHARIRQLERKPSSSMGYHVTGSKTQGAGSA